MFDEEKFFFSAILKMKFLDAGLIMSLLLCLLQSSHLLQVLQFFSEGLTPGMGFIDFLFRLQFPNLILICFALGLFLYFCVLCLEEG